MRVRNFLLLALLALLALPPAAAAARDRAARPWQQVIRDDDRKRLSGLYSAWTSSIAATRGTGSAAAVAALMPAVPAGVPATSAAWPEPGIYVCRTLKIGDRDGGAALTTGSFVPCAVRASDGGLRFEQLGGGRRIAGQLYPDGDRMIFLGSLALAQEMGVMAYGDDRDRDQVGVLRDLGGKRWRLELPWPKWESRLDLIEIVAG